MANMVDTATALANDPASQRESLEIVEATVGDGLLKKCYLMVNLLQSQSHLDK